MYNNYYCNEVPFETLKGKILKKILKENNDVLFFITNSGEKYKMYHAQDCCEGVYIEDICGDLDDLIGSPIIMAEEATSSEKLGKDICADSFLWTFYKLATNKGYVTIRWLGTSNGYYSESVSFITNKYDVLL